MRLAALFLSSLAVPGAGLAGPADGALGARIASSAAAAQGLQGPLDGNWSLIGPGGPPRFVFQIVDPASRPKVLQGAWREPSRNATLGVFTGATRSGDRLTLTFVVRRAPARVSLHRGRDGWWRGAMRIDHQVTAVSLRPGG